MWVLSTELVSCYASGVNSFDVASYLENVLLLLLLLLLLYSPSVVALGIWSIIMGFAKYIRVLSTVILKT